MYIFNVFRFGAHGHHHHYGRHHKVILNISHGEYICNVNARSGFYVDQVEFITNRGRLLGPVGGSDTQGSRHVLQDSFPLGVHLEDVYLGGVRGYTVHSEGKFYSSNFTTFLVWRKNQINSNSQMNRVLAWLSRRLFLSSAPDPGVYKKASPLRLRES